MTLAFFEVLELSMEQARVLGWCVVWRKVLQPIFMPPACPQVLRSDWRDVCIVSAGRGCGMDARSGSFEVGLSGRSVLQPPGPSEKPAPQAELVAGKSKGFEVAGLVLQPRDSLFVVYCLTGIFK